ncbi:sodium:proton antiporter [Marinilactibacillus sp. 15R]|uniref:cation:proton antiporter n=1 Tax=Marinilactibacillus sp. 15R TaxID=1911586 RepID=UPI00090C03C2|nr:sodium:proton antiporter [Marinilactibacillus sp. 15R]API89376.1 sodium:proton antiporter [Marinilactibacillus sp. 15R]
MHLYLRLIVLLLVSIIVYTIDVKKKYFPVPVILVVIGIGLSFLSLFSGLSISKNILYYIFIPGLLFVSAYQFSAKAFKKNASLMITLSTVGMVGTVLLLGAGIFWITSFFHPLPWSLSFLLASILVPTDPVSVVSILKNSTKPDEVADIVEGESMLNDGTSIVMFTIFLSMVETGNAFSVLNFLESFIFVSLGGVIVGLIFGWILSHAIHITSHHEYQIMLSIFIAYGSFMLAEELGFSGVLATVVSGIMLSFGFSKKNVKGEEFRVALGGFWNVVNPILMSILFLLIGIQSAPYLYFNYWYLAFMIFILSILARFIVLGCTLYLIPKWKKRFKNLSSALLVLSWAGIKGSMSVVLLLWTIDSALVEDPILISITFASILISFILQSLGIYPLTKILKRK